MTTNDLTAINRRALLQSGASLIGSSFLAPLAVALPVLSLAEPPIPYRYPGDVGDVIELSALYHGTSAAEILSATRQTRVVQARQTAMYISRLLNRRSLPATGRMFGSRDATTVLHAERKIAALVESDAFQKEKIERLTHCARRVVYLRYLAASAPSDEQWV